MGIYLPVHKEDIEMWKEKLQQIVQEMKSYDEEINDGATMEEMRLFVEKSKTELKVAVPDEYLKILEVVNGIEFNGFILYGIDEELLDVQQNQSIYGMIEYNKIWYENEWQKRYLFLGESNISWFVYDLDECQYCELDNPSGDEVEVFDNVESLVEKILCDALE